jgi:type I restriction enzyme, S subunit
MSWEIRKFGDVVEFPPKVKLQKKEQYSFIPMDEVEAGRKYVGPQDLKEWKGSGGARFGEGDTLFARITPCLQNGKIAQAKELINGKGFGSTEFFIFRGIEGVTDTDFVYYLSINSEFTEYAIGSMVGASGRQRADAKFIREYEFNLPLLKTQKRIADILSAYDDLIENNLKRIKLLEQAAQNIYKEWFVNLRFPGHENTYINEETGLPKGWEIKRSDEVFKINIGKTPPRKESEWFSIEDGYKWVSISDMNKSSVFIQKTKERITDTGVSRFNVKVVPKGTVLLSFKLTIGSVVIATEDMVTNEAIAHFNIDKNTSLSTEYTYCHLSCFPYKTLGSTSSIGQALNSKIVKSIPVLLPQQDLVSLFTKRVKPTFLQLENLITQNQKLKAARDILLPRLMNRTIEI